ncbi:MAG: hypothetical protein LBV27_08540 [Oscillospiraceae bacterium]|jgi:hypothetical protein|nr:hypothetical protein [Oscillospiraceae bacterium]
MNFIERGVSSALLSLIIVFIFAACAGQNDATDNVFPNIDNVAIPDVLEKTVGTVGDTYFTAFGKSDNPDYQSYLSVTFKDTTEADYTTLTEHYQSASTGTAEDGALLFDWGWLYVNTDQSAITVNAYIK